MEGKMKRYLMVFANLLVVLLISSAMLAQPANQAAVLKPGDNLVVENIPPVPAAIAEKANQYGEFRSAGFEDWDPVKREMLIGTRFADVPQIHRVKMPGGDRTQLTFFPDRTGGGHFGPKVDYIASSKDVVGGVWFQFSR